MYCFRCRLLFVRSKLCYVNSLRAFLTLNDVEFNFLTFLKRFETFSVDPCIMNENVVSFRITDESKTALVVESSDDTLIHDVTSDIVDK